MNRRLHNSPHTHRDHIHNAQKGHRIHRSDRCTDGEEDDRNEIKGSNWDRNVVINNCIYLVLEECLVVLLRE